MVLNMNGFTPVVSDELYANSLFPSIPPVPDGFAVLLTDGKFPPVLVDNKLSVRQIRNGKYTRQVLISTTVHQIYIYFNMPSKNDPYLFEVRVTADIRVSDPIAFFQTRIADLSIALNRILSPDVRRTCKNCAIKDCKTLDDDILFKIQPNNFETNIAQSGLAYYVTDVEARPDSGGMSWLERETIHKFKVEEETHKVDVASQLSEMDIKKALLGEVAAGNLTMAQALIEIDRQKREHGFRQVNDAREMVRFINELRDAGHYTNTQAAALVNNLLHTQKLLDTTFEDKQDDKEETADSDSIIESLYKEEDL